MAKYIDDGALLESYCNHIVKSSQVPSSDEFSASVVEINRRYNVKIPLVAMTGKRAKTNAKMFGDHIDQGRGPFSDEMALTLCGGRVHSNIKKSGTSDLTTHISEVKRMHRQGCPLVVRVVRGDCPSIPRDWSGEIPAYPENVQQRFVNILTLIDYEVSQGRDPWSEKADKKNQLVWVRQDFRKSVGKAYPRMSVNLGKVPAHLWMSEWAPLDDSPVPMRLDREINPEKIRAHRKYLGFEVYGHKVTVDGVRIPGIYQKLHQFVTRLCTAKGEPVEACREHVKNLRALMSEEDAKRIKNIRSHGYIIIPKGE